MKKRVAQIYVQFFGKFTKIKIVHIELSRVK